MIPRPKAVVFDFDYTLADSSPGVIECVRYALDRLGLPAVSNHQVCQTIGLSLPDTFYALTGGRQAEPSEIFARLFVERAEEVMHERTVLFPAVPATVEQLRQRRIVLGIVSTKYRRRIEGILRREGLLHAFEVIVGGEDVAQHKPDPQGLLVAIQTLGIESALRNERALYVGDSVTDAQTARSADVPFVATLTGTTPREAFAGFDVRAFVANLTELPGILA